MSGPMAEIRLPCGRVALIDAADLPLIEGYNLYATSHENVTYVDCLPKPGLNKKRTLLHTLITGFKMTDHKNRNGLDCRRENMRPCSKAQNSRNAVKHRDAVTSQYKGVHFDKSRNKWSMGICVDRKITRRRYDTEIEAALAYDALARKHFGEFANLNFPDAAR
jgi:hypothetical protein